MIYLFRKRNGSIIAATKESAHQLFTAPLNFITHQPEFLGAVSDADMKAVGVQVEKDVPIKIEKLVKKDGEDTLITLDAGMIADAIADGDERMEKKYEGILKARQEAHNALLEDLAAKADTTLIPAAYSHKVAAVEDVKGDVSGVLAQYQRE